MDVVPLRGFNRLKIKQPLALDALDRRDHPLAVRDLAVIPAKLELGAITVKVLLAQLMEDAIVSTLQESVEALGGVDVLPVDVNVNLRRVVDGRVSARERSANAKIRSEVVGDDFCRCIDVDKDVLGQRVLGDVRSWHRRSLALHLARLLRRLETNRRRQHRGIRRGM